MFLNVVDVVVVVVAVDVVVVVAAVVAVEAGSFLWYLCLLWAHLEI